MSELKERKHEWVRPTDEKYDFRTCVKCGKRTAFYMMYDKSECPGKEGETVSKLEDEIAGIIRHNVKEQGLSGGYGHITILNEGDSAEQIIAAIITRLESCPAPRATEEDDALIMKREMIKSLRK